MMSPAVPDNLKRVSAQSTQPQQSPAIGEGAPIVYAGFARRAASLAVDVALGIGFYLAVARRAYDHPVSAALPLVAVSWVLMAGYTIVFHAHWGRTVGKMVAGIKVRRLDGGAIGYREALLRSSVDVGLTIGGFICLAITLSRWAPPEWSTMRFIEKMQLLESRDPTGGVLDWAGQIWFWSELLVLLFNEKRRAIHDYIAGTVVVVE